jgi:NAD(P)-dependent dehydrogenase (short-subunit alcohol dehydrogenase family)
VDGAAIVNTASINSKSPSPNLPAYATTKGAIANFTAGVAEMVAEKGVRVNSLAPGPIWSQHRAAVGHRNHCATHVAAFV